MGILINNVGLSYPHAMARQPPPTARPSRSACCQNSSGSLTPHPLSRAPPPPLQYLHELDQDYAEQMINVNCRSTVRMCKLVLPGMLSRKRGAILNIGSAAATVLPADPLYSVYAGSKGCVFESWERGGNMHALRAKPQELTGAGVRCFPKPTNQVRRPVLPHPPHRVRGQGHPRAAAGARWRRLRVSASRDSRLLALTRARCTA